MVSLAAPFQGGIQPTPSVAPLKTQKSITRRLNLVRKRHEMEIEDLENSPSLNPSKKVKVEFSDEVEVRLMHDWELAPAFVREEVRRALEERASGEFVAYEKIVQLFKPEEGAEFEPPMKNLRSYIVGLTSSAASLTRSCSTLIGAILQSDWIRRDESYFTLVLRFLGHLVSAQGVWLGDVLRMLVGYMTINPPSVSSQVTALTSRQTVQRRAHHTLQYITRLIPSASTVLASVVIGLFPHPADSRRAHIIYVRNLLQIIEYAPELESEILALITERMVKIDVQVQHAVEDLAEELGERVVEAIGALPTSEMDLEDEEDESDEDSDPEEDDIDEEAQRAKEITRDVEKLDIVLDLLFAYYSKLMASSSIDKRDAVIDNLLSQFSNTILPTYHSRHTQFLLFHFAQTSPESIETFVSKCILLTRDLGRPSLLRQSAAAYLASFVARGVHVPAQIVRDVFDVIGDQLSDLRHDFEPSCRGPDLRRYSIYYSLVQALLYIFCFRWRDLEAGLHEAADGDDLVAVLQDDDDEQHIWIPGIKDTLSSNIFSPLNPLKVCSSSIVSEFAKIAHHVGILYVYHLIETNKRLRLVTSYSSSDRIATGYNTPNRETALTARIDDAYAQLDPYFPFDPYQLPRSKQWIEGDYREWTGIPGVHDRGVIDSDSEDDDEVDSELDDEQATGTEGEDDDLD